MIEFPENTRITWGTKRGSTSSNAAMYYDSVFFHHTELEIWDNVLVKKAGGRVQPAKIEELWEDINNGRKLVKIRWYIERHVFSNRPKISGENEVFLAVGDNVGAVVELDLVGKTVNFYDSSMQSFNLLCFFPTLFLRTKFVGSQKYLQWLNIGGTQFLQKQKQ